MLADIFLIAFGVITLLQVLVYFLVFGQVAFHRSKPVAMQQWPALSVIVAARNEADNLVEYLPKVLEQDYPNFEVIVVDDCSVDETPDVLRAMQQRYPHLKVTAVKENREFEGGKKFALTLGIKKAANNKLIFIDADCYPTSKNWLKLMSNALDKSKIVLGYGALEKENSLLNALLQFETATIALQYLGLAKIGMPYMAVGRNLAYHQDLFFENKGFSNHMHLKSGDDDLFINEVATSRNTSVVFNYEAFTYSPAKNTWNNYLKQKTRH